MAAEFILYYPGVGRESALFSDQGSPYQAPHRLHQRGPIYLPVWHLRLAGIEVRIYCCIFRSPCHRYPQQRTTQKLVLNCLRTTQLFSASIFRKFMGSVTRLGCCLDCECALTSSRVAMCTSAVKQRGGGWGWIKQKNSEVAPQVSGLSRSMRQSPSAPHTPVAFLIGLSTLRDG